MRRIKQLDIARAMAILLVLGRHVQFSQLGKWPADMWAPAQAFLTLWERCGWAGVDLFFVLSGYLVSGLLFGEHLKYGTLNLKRFFIRRGLKIYPAFYVLLGATVVAHFAHLRPDRHPFGLWSLLSEALFVQNYGPFLWTHTWSLAVEEHFYILLGLGLLLLFRLRRNAADPFRPLLVIFPVVAVTLLALRIMGSHGAEHFDFRAQLGRTHLRMDSLLFGVLLCYLSNYHRAAFTSFVTWYRWPILVLSAALSSLCLILPLTHPFMHTVGVTLAYLAFGGLLVVALNWPASKQPAKGFAPLGKLLALIGLNSYSIYLWHSPVLQAGPILQRKLLGHYLSFGASTALYVVGSIVLGIVMAKIVEMPFLRLRDKLCPPRSA